MQPSIGSWYLHGALRTGARWMWLILIVLAACAHPKPGLSSARLQILHISGSSEMEAQVEQFQQNLRTTQPVTEVRYTPTNTATGLKLLKVGQADIALASWLPQGAPTGYASKKVGHDAVVFIIHPAAGIINLTEQQIEDIFSGRDISWRSLGGNDIPIRLVVRERGSGTQTMIESRLMRGKSVALTAQVMPSAPDVVDYVRTHEGAIGYVSFSLLGREVQPIAINGILPTTTNIRTDVYPLTRDVFAVFPSRMKPFISNWP